MAWPRRNILRLPAIALFPALGAGLRVKTARFGGAISSEATLLAARRLIRSETFGLNFCRVADSDGAWLAAAQFALGHPKPAVILACDRVQPGSSEGVWFHGARATLAITPAGAATHPIRGAHL